jgi:hypothetical protein
MWEDKEITNARKKRDEVEILLVFPYRSVTMVKKNKNSVKFIQLRRNFKEHSKVRIGLHNFRK